MESLVAQHGEYIVLAILLVEWALGNTKLVKANSSIAAVLEGLQKVLNLFKPKAKK